MKEKNILLPHKYKKMGWIILIPAAILGIILLFNGGADFHLNMNVFSFVPTGFIGDKSIPGFHFIEWDVKNTLVGILFLIGLFLVGFSKEKREDEYIEKLRLNSLLWAVLINYGLLFIAFLFIYGFSFFTVMVINMFTVLIIYIIRFNGVLFFNYKAMKNEK